ncbi:hypothetical protein PVAND_011991 [Polypedilum vanderplanki]|uniref:6-phosphogluconolactonase n=1 Tax=Polypedilum vanderplanki TaxID=319348 RepID=A0A9J6CL01_POLVA|nr:hypothetical protein PVAND_011991 [Polypedilum vanderplanki]
MPVTPIVLHNEASVLNKFQELIEEIANESINDHDHFYVGFSGGSLGKYLCQILPKIKTDWSKWTIFFCDERYVDESDNESTFGFYKNNLIPLVALTEQQFISININDPIEKVADDYEKIIRQKFNMIKDVPSFDCLLLGVGPDGHTASLFPDHHILNENERLITWIIDSPKPPPKRITMTFPLINNAKYSIFTVPGKGKAEIIKKIFEDKIDFPAAKVNSKKVIWLLDQDSASECSIKFDTV